MFADISFSVEELKPLLAKKLSKIFTKPINADELFIFIFKVHHITDDDGNLKEIIASIEIPREPE